MSLTRRTDRTPPTPMSMHASDFLPHRLLRNAHLQSVLASSGVRRWLFRRRRQALETGSVEHILDCGDGVRLQGFYSAQAVRETARGLAILLHGWEGSVQSGYLLHTGARLLSEGWDVFRLNFRDHGDTHHLNPELFHSCRLDEVVGAVQEVARRFPSRPLVLAGFSLGGNFALRIALRAPAVGLPLSYALAVCPAVHPPAILDAIERAPWFYHAYFMRKWRDSLKRKKSLFPEAARFTESELNVSMRELTATMVERHTDFGSLDAYLNGYSIAGDRLADLSVPTTILTAADDPIIPVEGFHDLKLSASTELEIAPAGGHCGFIRDFSLRSWTEDYISVKFGRVAP
ncbi:YheT family hydrolase [Tahibacter amnicola]|uniref:Alpha/beta fold hydrolase n=1 Tax=Tahibacter amnicola TaxID=2976241 RepID=A0ABY6BEM6_9GAMM|nr:alpha/beta fold hydrolase [Tahibacter amnicola]UXI68309.1 alpha/beta fold hydrolase [Tahibacter amnicola]